LHCSFRAKSVNATESATCRVPAAFFKPEREAERMGVVGEALVVSEDVGYTGG
jgi:hypothetical protein